MRYNGCMRFADMLAEAMEGMTQAQLADNTGLRASTICRLLNRQRTPSYKTMVALERALPKLRELRLKDAA